MLIAEALRLLRTRQELTQAAASKRNLQSIRVTHHVGIMDQTYSCHVDSLYATPTMVISISDRLGKAIAQHDYDLDDLQTSLADLSSARKHLKAAGGQPSTSSAPADEVEMAAAELLRQTVLAHQKVRRSLSALKLFYAVLWVRGHRADSASENTTEFDDRKDLRVWALDRLSTQLETLIASADKRSEGRSRDGRVSAAVDSHMRLVELDCDASLLADPEYQVSLIEAVNAGIEPVFRRKGGFMEQFLSGPDSFEESESATDEEGGAVSNVLSAFCGLGIVQYELGELLPRISRGEDLPHLEEQIDEVTSFAQEAEEELRDIQSLHSYRALLNAAADLPEMTGGDLVEVEDLKQLFFEEELDDFGELDGAANAARELIDVVAAEFQRQRDQEQEKRHWQIMERRMRYQLAGVERQTFEGRSQEGSISAHAEGTVKLVALELDADRHGPPAQIKARVIEAINAAIEAASHQRSAATRIALDPG